MGQRECDRHRVTELVFWGCGGYSRGLGANVGGEVGRRPHWSGGCGDRVSRGVRAAGAAGTDADRSSCHLESDRRGLPETQTDRRMLAAGSRPPDT